MKIRAWYSNFIGIGISWGTLYVEKSLYVCFDLPFCTVQIYINERKIQKSVLK